jgi:hypothetical protein
MGRRIREDRIAGYRRSMPAAKFAREFLGWWDEPDAELGLDLSNWPLLADLTSEPAGAVAYGIAVSPGQEWAAVGLAGARADGQHHVDVGRHHRGTSWVVKTCLEVLHRDGAATFVIDGGGPGSFLIPALTEAGVPLEVVGMAEAAKACGLLLAGVQEKTLQHRDQAELNDAVESAKARTSGDGLILLGRKASGEDITALESVMFALYGYVTFYAGAPNLW